MCRLHANTTPFYIRDLSIPEFGYPQQVLEPVICGHQRMTTLVIRFRAHPNSGCSHLKILKLISSAKTLFPNRVIFTGFLWNIFFGGATIQPTTTIYFNSYK